MFLNVDILDAKFANAQTKNTKKEQELKLIILIIIIRN